MIGFIVGVVATFGLYLIFPDTFQKVADFIKNSIAKLQNTEK